MRKTADVSGTVEFLETSHLVTILIFIATVAAIVLISFVGVSSVNLPVLPNQLSAVRITASAPFEYTSQEKTRFNREQARTRVPRVYQLELTHLQRFETHIRELLAQLETFEKTHAETGPADSRRAALTPIVTAAGLDLGGLLGGAIISEQVFNFTGLGWNSIQAINNSDLPIIVAVVVVASFFIVIANLVVDVLYGVIDPRVRLS
jgi:ABC-type microcin C transport system permease subunit YejB